MSEEQRAGSRRLLLIALLTLLLAVTQFIAAFRSARLPVDLAAQISLILPLEFIAGIAWGSALLVSGIRLWRARRSAVAIERHFALRFALAVLAAFAVYGVVRLWIFARADYDRGRFAFLLALLAAVLALMGLWWAAQRQTVRSNRRSNGDK